MLLFGKLSILFRLRKATALIVGYHGITVAKEHILHVLFRKKAPEELLIIGSYAVLCTERVGKKQFSVIKACLMAGHIPVACKCIYSWIGGHLLTGQPLINVAIIDAMGRRIFPNQFVHHCQHIFIIKKIAAVKEIDIFSPRLCHRLVHGIINTGILRFDHRDMFP